VSIIGITNRVQASLLGELTECEVGVGRRVWLCSSRASVRFQFGFPGSEERGAETQQSNRTEDGRRGNGWIIAVRQARHMTHASARGQLLRGRLPELSRAAQVAPM